MLNGNGKSIEPIGVPISVPSLDEIARNASLVLGLPQPVLLDIAARGGAIVAAANAALTALAAANVPTVGAVTPESDKWLSAADAAALLGKPRRWLFEHSDLPFVRRLSKKGLLCSAHGLRAWIDAQRR